MKSQVNFITDLDCLLPHDGIESGVILITEHKAYIVIIYL